jgi:hypothetical protein
MDIKPVVRYMLLCDDWRLNPHNKRRITIVGLISNINALDQSPYPLIYREMCVFLALTECRGEGEGQIVCIFEETGQKIFETTKRPITFGDDPLEVVGVPFRIRNCKFPFPGLYSVQFWYNEVKIVEHPLLLR